MLETVLLEIYMWPHWMIEMLNDQINGRIF